MSGRPCVGLAMQYGRGNRSNIGYRALFLNAKDERMMTNERNY